MTSILHAPKPLRFLIDLVGLDKVVLGTGLFVPRRHGAARDAPVSRAVGGRDQGRSPTTIRSRVFSRI